VTLCAFLEAAAGAAGRLGTEQRLSCVVDWQRPCQSPDGGPPPEMLGRLLIDVEQAKVFAVPNCLDCCL